MRSDRGRCSRRCRIERQAAEVERLRAVYELAVLEDLTSATWAVFCVMATC
jgi:hypothetical protein